ncbi:unnamed protein product [Alopecurus aequalis]
MAKATGKHRRDNFYHMAKEQGYRSRAAIKLLQLDTCWRFLSTARAVLDLGAAPGGWLQVAVRGATPDAFVFGVDLSRIRPVRGAISLAEDITATARCGAAVRRLMDSKGVAAFDVVLHDSVGRKKKRKRDGARAQEASSQSALLIDALRLATMFLAPKGAFITKVFSSGRICFVRRTRYIGRPICKARSASDFIWSEAQTPQEILGSFMGVSFDDPASLPIKNHELTTAEIQNFCEDLDVLNKKTLNYVWEWRTRIRHALSSCSQVTPKPGVTVVDAKVDSAELDMDEGIGDGGKEETQTHEEMVSDEEKHWCEGMFDEAGEVKQQRKRANPSSPQKPKKRARVSCYKENALVLVDPSMKDKNTSGSDKKVGKEDAKRRRARRAPQQARKKM